MKKLSNKLLAVILGVVFVLCAAYTGYVFYQSSQTPATDPDIEGPIAVIYVDGYMTDVVDLGKVTENYTKTYKGSSENTNTVEFSHGRVRVQSATCPDRICISQGWLKEGDILPIACLPNSLIIEVLSYDDVMSEVDGVTN